MAKVLYTQYHGGQLTSPANMASVTEGDLIVRADHLCMVTDIVHRRVGAVVVSVEATVRPFVPSSSPLPWEPHWMLGEGWPVKIPPNTPVNRVVGGRSQASR